MGGAARSFLLCKTRGKQRMGSCWIFWLTLWDDFRNCEVPEWVDYADILIN